MIVGGRLTYGAFGSNLDSWRLSSNLLNELLLAALVTVLSYQGAALLIDLCLGIKSYGRAKLWDIHTVLLVRRYAPIAVARSLFPNLFRSRDNRQKIVYELNNESETAARAGVLAKLFFLLLAVPLINMGTVILSLERDTKLSFSEAKFGGLALGIDTHDSITEWHTEVQGCQSTPLKLAAGETAEVQFLLCQEPVFQESVSDKSNIIRVTVSSLDSFSIHVVVTIGRLRMERKATASIAFSQSREEQKNDLGLLYYIKQSLTKEKANELVQYGLGLATERCSKEEGKEFAKRVIEKVRENRSTWGMVVKCNLAESTAEEERKILEQVVEAISANVTLVNDRSLEIKPEDTLDEHAGEIIRADDLLLITRRRSYVSVPRIALAAIVVTLLRLLTGVLTRNDLDRGIGLIVRDGLGLPCCDSMLAADDVVVTYEPKKCVLTSVD